MRTQLDLLAMLGDHSSGDRIVLRVRRGETELDLPITLREQ